MNMNEIAVHLAGMDKGFEELDIAQIKRVLKCLGILMVEKPIVISTMIKNGQKNSEKEVNL